MRPFWKLLILTLLAVIYQAQSVPNGESHEESDSSLTDRMDRIERLLLNLEQQVGINRIKRLPYFLFNNVSN